MAWAGRGQAPLCPVPAVAPTMGDVNTSASRLDESGVLSLQRASGWQRWAQLRGPMCLAPCRQQCEPGGPQGYSCHVAWVSGLLRMSRTAVWTGRVLGAAGAADVCQLRRWLRGATAARATSWRLMASAAAPLGAMGARASQDLGDGLLDEGTEEEDEEEAWEAFDGGWTEMPGIPWMEAHAVIRL